MEIKNLDIGDRLVREKGGIFTKHHAIYVGEHNGIELVAENQIGFGVRCITLNQFLNEDNLVRIEKNNFNLYQKNNVIHRVNQRMGKQYDLINYNCEHFVNEVLTGITESKQVKFVVAGVVLVGLLALIYTASD